MTYHFEVEPPPGLVEVRAALKRAHDSVTAAMSAELDVRIAWASAFRWDLAVSEALFTGDDLRVCYARLEPGAEVEDTMGMRWWVYRCGGGA